MKQFLMAAALLAGLATGFHATTRADEPKKDDAMGKSSAEAAMRLAMALELADLGRQTKSAETLVAAAKLLATAGFDPDKAPRKDGPAPGKDAEKPKVEAKVPTVEDLFAEAKKLSDKKEVADLITAVRKEVGELKRGEIDGPQTHYGSVGPGRTATWTAVFVVGELASWTIASSDQTTYTVNVVDGLGGSVTKTGRNVSFNWTPKSTKTYTMRITNNSGQYSNFRIINN